MDVILTTSRLLLREFDLQDSFFVQELCTTPTWLQYIGDRGINTLADAVNYILNGPMHSYRVNGFGLWVTVLKDTGKPIGMCGLIKRDMLEDVDIGYALLPAYEGQGYAFEAATATVKHALHQLNLPRVAAITALDNQRSIAVLEKIGFQFKKNIRLSPEEKELKLFAYEAVELKE
jgi:RimJ/RimL family protein N-acetyltransferase